MNDSRALIAPAAERNRTPILDVLRLVLPAQGLVVEIGSGTGQHIVHFAGALPELHWQPSDPDPAMRESIRAHIANAECGSIAEPLDLDARDEEWPIRRADAVLSINMIHIAPWSAAEGLVRGAAGVLGPGAPLVLYGPFRREGRHTSASNETFDASLRQRNPEWGVRDVESVSALADAFGLELSQLFEMPANNLTLVYSRSAGSE